MPLRRVLLLFALVLATVQTAQAQSYRDGLQAFRSGQTQQAFEIWKPLAEAGDPSAQFGLAVIYEKGGGGIAQDLDSAVRWYEQAAIQGIAAAQNNLGHMYSQGLGVAQDKARAVELWQEAAKGGHVLSYYNLGLAYYRGEGTRRNEREAAKWFREAADAGLADGQFAIGEMYRLGIGTERNEARALAWYNLAAAQGHQMGGRLAAMLQEKGVRPAPVASTAVDQSPATEDSQIELAAPVAPSAGERIAPPPPSASLTPTPPAPQPSAAPPTPPAPVAVAPTPPAPVAVAPTPPARERAEPKAIRIDPPQQTAKAEAQPPNVITGGSTSNGGIPTITGQSLEGVHIWLASMKSTDAAMGHWKEVQSKHARLFEGLPPHFAKVDLGTRGTYYRVMVGPLATRESARDVCQQMRNNDPAAFCKVLVR